MVRHRKWKNISPEQIEQVGITEKCKCGEKESGREVGEMFVSIKTIKYKK